MALDLADFAGFEARRAEAEARGKLRGIGISNTIERAAAGGFEAAEIRFDRGGTVDPARRGSITQGMGHETVYKQLLCDRLGIASGSGHLHPGRHRQGRDRRGHRRLALGGAGRLGGADGDREDRRQGEGDRRASARSRRGRHRFRRRRFPSPAPTARVPLRQIAAEPPGTRRSLPHGMEPGLVASARLRRRGAEFPERRAISASSRSTPRPARSRSCATSVVDDVGTVMNPLLLEGPDPRRHRAGRRPGCCCEDIRFDPRDRASC